MPKDEYIMDLQELRHNINKVHDGENVSDANEWFERRPYICHFLIVYHVKIHNLVFNVIDSLLQLLMINCSPLMA